jgi:cytochrome P450
MSAPLARLGRSAIQAREGTDVSTPSTIAPADPAPPVPPVVPGSALLGSARDLRRDMLAACERAFHEYGDVVRFQAGPPGRRLELLLVFHPDGAHRVLAGAAANYRKDNVFYQEIRGAFGDGLLTSQDEQWQRQKRFLQPLFTSRRVAGYADAMSDQVGELVRRWQGAPSRELDLHDQMTQLTLRTVCRILFGGDVERILPVVQRSFGPLGEAVRRRAMAPLRPPVGWPTPVNWRLARAQLALYEVCDQIIARRRASGSGGEQDLVGLLLAARDDGSGLSDAEIRDQVLIFLLAGHETTSTALTFTLDLLGRHPEVQRRVRAEVDEVLGDRTPTAGDVPALALTTRTLKEAMRLYPSAPLIGRMAVADDELCGYRIPARSNLAVVPWVIHRHPGFWDEPGRFDPERFTPEREKARHHYAWLPFGGGPRGCIGQHFSMLESVIALAMLVRDFEFAAPAAEPRYTNHITLRPTSGVPSRVSPRP